MKHTLIVAPFLALLSFAACNPPPVPTEPSGASSASAEASAESAPSASAAASASAPAPAPQKAVQTWTEGFATPESVLYDAARDRYLVSNINGAPSGADNNGYILVLDPEGKTAPTKLVEGGTKSKAGKAVKLDAPKGSALVGDVLYVADLTRVRMFDVVSGEPKGEVALPGATFANDVVAAADGKVYVSDTGVKIDAKGLAPTGTDAVYVIEKGKAKVLAKSAELGKPNGLQLVGGELFVVTFGSGELYSLDGKGVRGKVVKPTTGQLDGFLALDGGAVLISSWEGKSVLRGNVSGPFEVVLKDLEAPADIGFDSKRKRVLVPRFMGNTVEAFELK